MAQQLIARVTCPNCRTTFGIPIEQVLDVEIDPSAKARLLAGQVNLAICPTCGFASVLEVPFIYHDPRKELALVYMPMAAGRTDMERQQAIGALSRAVMSTLPQEQRKSYLINPQVFLSYESLVNRVLEADGITQEMIQAQRDRADLLRRLLEAATPEERMALVRENEAMLDENFFRILSLNLEQADALGRGEVFQKLMEIRTLLLEQTAVGRKLAARSRALQALQAEPTREKLLDLLVETEDPATRAVLVTFGQPLVDYLFFQKLTQRIESATDEGVRQRLEALREEVMGIREQIRAQAREEVQTKRHLLRDLLTSEQPELLARRRLVELDDLFLSVLASEIESAQQAGDRETLSRLQEVWQLVMRLLQEQVPPELLLLTQLMEAPDEETMRQVLENNARLLNSSFLALLERVEQDMRGRGEEEVARKAARALELARTITPAQPEEKRPPQRPSGLVMVRG
ncbi:MAG: CpXC domain-containing protein [Anaerolineae bacterium]|nr:CpXC domain-containing protein [Anaerolineae bacterium]